MTTSGASGPEPDPLVRGFRRRPLGAAAAGALSLMLAASLLVLFPLGLVIAPLAVVPVLQRSQAGHPSVLAWGWVVAVLAVLALTGATVLGLPVVLFLVTYLMVVVVPVVSIELWRRIGCDEGRWAAATTAAGSLLCMALVMVLAWPAAPLDGLAEWWRQAAASAEESYRALGVSSGQLELALDAVEPVAPWALTSLPVACLIVVLFWVRPRLPFLGFPQPVVPFERFRVDEWLPAGFALAGIGTLVLGGTARWVSLNLLIAVLLLYFVQGLAMIRAHLARWIGRGWLVRWGVALLCLQGPLPLLVAVLGLADGFFPLRPRASDDDGGAS